MIGLKPTRELLHAEPGQLGDPVEAKSDDAQNQPPTNHRARGAYPEGTAAEQDSERVQHSCDRRHEEEIGEQFAEVDAAARDGSEQQPVDCGTTGPLPSDSRLALGQIESMTYMRNQLLRDSDWASMDHSVELRTPLVDAHLLSQVQPLLANFYRFPGKSLLAGAPDRPLPLGVINRKKTGFGIPVSRWLRDEGHPVKSNDMDAWMNIHHL